MSDIEQVVERIPHTVERRTKLPSENELTTRAESTNSSVRIDRQTIEAAEDGDLSIDVIFDVLKNERRRLVLQYLWEQGSPAQLGPLADYITAVENDKAVADITSSERKRVYVGLYQCHLPRMHSAKIIDFDRNRGTISLTDSAAQLSGFFATSEDDEDQDDEQSRWAIYSLTLSVVAAIVFTITQLLVAPVAGLTEVLFVATIIGMVVLSAVQLAQSRPVEA